MIRSTLAALCLIFVSIAAHAAGSYGVVDFLEGDVQCISAEGKTRALRIGDAIEAGETIVTAHNGEVHVRTADYGFAAIRPDSRLKVDAYRADGDAGDRAALTLLKGTLRSITGWIGKYRREGYVIRASTVTIGIRGTDHEPLLVPPGNGGTAPGVYDKVNSGGTYIASGKARVNVDAAHAGFAPHNGAEPLLLAEIPAIYKPTKNEARIAQRKEEVARELEAARLKAQQAAKERAAASKAAGKSEAKQDSPASAAAAKAEGAPASASAPANPQVPPAAGDTAKSVAAPGGESGEPAKGADEKASADKPAKEQRRRRHHAKPPGTS